MSQKQLGLKLRPRLWLGMKMPEFGPESCCKRLPGVHIPLGECFLDFDFWARLTPHPPPPKCLLVCVCIYVYIFIYLFIYLFI